MTKRALLLRSLLKQKRRVTFWANFQDRLVPINAIAVGIRTTAVKHFAALRLLDDQLTFATGPGTGDASRLLLDVFALGIV